MEPKKLYIIDTNVFIHDARALFAFKGGQVGIPLTVIQELDKFKTETSARGRNAREVIRSLDKMRELGSLAQGVELEDGTHISIIVPPPDGDVLKKFGQSGNDDLILATALAAKAQGRNVCLISKDLNMRVRADALGVVTEDYQKESIAEDSFYKGWIEIPVPAGELTQDDQGRIMRLLEDAKLDQPLYYNEFIFLQSERNPENYRVWRYQGDGSLKPREATLRPVHPPHITWPIGPKNPQQLMAFDLLFDDNVQLVTLFGPAGTGKTFLALVAALHKLLVEHEYKKILVARPVEPLGRDIGYLPGDIQEKLYSWMQPVRDNMDFIMYKAQSGYERGLYEDAQGREEKDDGKGRRRKRDGRWKIPSLDELARTDKVSLEAITYMRGRSIPDQYILIDEVQNLTPHEVKTLITRVGEGSKIILAGDPYQIDSPYLDFSSNGLVVTSEKFKGQKIFGSVFLEKSERSELSTMAAQLL